MSSYNDSVEYASQNDSIPLEEASASVSGSGSVSGSYFTEEESQEIDVDTGDRQVTRRRSRNSSARDESYFDDTLPSGSASQITGHSEDFSGTNPNAPSYTDGNDYSSTGHGSLSYDDSTLRSPYSSSFSEMSSTFASFYYENEAVRKVRRTVSFLRLPIVFFSFALVGSNAAENLLRAVNTFAQHRYAAVEVLEQHVRDIPPAADPSATFPQWLLHLRAQLPGVVENSARRLLTRFGIPVAADAHDACVQAYEQFTSGVQKLKDAWYVTSSVVSFSLFLPLFTYCVLYISQEASSRKHNRTNSLFDMTEADGEPQGLSPYSTVNRTGDVRSVASTLNFSRNESELGSSPIRVETASDGPASVPSLNKGEVPALHSGNADEERDVPTQRPQVDGPGSGGVDSARRPGSLMSTLPPGSSNDTPRTTATERSATEGDVVGAGSAVDTKRPEPVKKPPASADESRGATPDGSEDEDEEDDDDPGVLTPAPRSPPGESRTDYTLDGDIVLALVGEPDASEANEMVMAANKYGCSVVLLPASVPESRLVLLPPSVRIEFCDDVLTRAREVAAQRELSSTGVFVSRVVRKAVSMRSYVHPMNVLYMFVASDSMSTLDVANNTTTHIYTGTTLASDLPVNELLYDRYRKAQRSASQSNSRTPQRVQPTIDDNEL